MHIKPHDHGARPILRTQAINISEQDPKTNFHTRGIQEHYKQKFYLVQVDIMSRLDFSHKTAVKSINPSMFPRLLRIEHWYKCKQDINLILKQRLLSTNENTIRHTKFTFKSYVLFLR